MRTGSLLSLGAVTATALAADGVFEPVDFNVTDALIANGVDVASIPDLLPLVEKRSILDPCAIAVSPGVISIRIQLND